jgi:WhiB family redox-sensing transcriptional regulator
VANDRWPPSGPDTRDLPRFRQEAACARSSDPDLWFPDDDEPDFDLVQLAKLVCHHCPVQKICLVYAMDNNETYGIWGGLTRAERVTLTS